MSVVHLQLVARPLMRASATPTACDCEIVWSTLNPGHVAQLLG